MYENSTFSIRQGSTDNDCQRWPMQQISLFAYRYCGQTRIFRGGGLWQV